MGYAATRILRLFGKGLLSLAACGLALALGGCGGIEFQGKVFDYAGLSSLGKGQEDVRMTERAPLLVPPNTHKLPPPGSPEVTRADWPADTDKERKRLAEARQAEERKKAAASEPNNPYAGKPNLLDQVLGRNKTPEEEPIDVPEPDPSDKTAEDRAREQAAGTAAQKPVDQSLNAPTPTGADDPFHPAAPDSYKGMSSPSGNNANW
ncbi:MAG TPA: hypothetical protein VLE24_00700 [Methyloceanibacter sp.]|nr:hypothetical protein [Methyloceanibacter sp.]